MSIDYRLVCSEQGLGRVALVAGMQCRPSITSGEGWCVVADQGNTRPSDAFPRIIDCRVLVKEAVDVLKPECCERVEPLMASCGQRHAPVLLVVAVWSKASITDSNMPAGLYWASGGSEQLSPGTAVKIALDPLRPFGPSELRQLMDHVAAKGAIPDALS